MNIFYLNHEFIIIIIIIKKLKTVEDFSKSTEKIHSSNILPGTTNSND